MDLRITARRVLVRGTIAGLLATAAMSAVFVAGDRIGTLGRKPPRIIVDHFLPVAPKKASDRIAVVSHFAYGAAGGVGFAAIFRPARASTAARVARGVVFGLTVWAASYEGWLPAIGVLPPAHRDRPKRVWTVVAAHVVYGASLGLLSGESSPTLSKSAKGSSVNP